MIPEKFKPTPKTITKEELNKIIDSLPDNYNEKLLTQGIKDYLFEKDYQESLKTKAEQVTKFLKHGVFNWDVKTNQLTVSCKVNSITKEDLILVNDCIIRYFDYTITPSLLDNGILIITFTENLTHKESLRSWIE